MLPKENRLKKKKDIENVFRKGESFREGLLVLKILKNNLGISRFGFIVSKKKFKKATLRNKIKRKLRELFRIKLDKIKKGIDGIIIAGAGLEDENFREIEGAIDKLIKKTKITKW